MVRKALVESLRSFDFTRDMQSSQIEKIASMAKEVSFSEGETVFREGDLSHELYVILDGRVAVEIHIPSRGWITVLTAGPGHLVGWTSLFPPQRKTASVRAVKATRAIVIDGKKLREACEEDHDLGYWIFWRLAEIIAERLRATRLQLLDMFEPPSKA
jgi:CRP-like cAMP-binding protein